MRFHWLCTTCALILTIFWFAGVSHSAAIERSRDVLSIAEQAQSPNPPPLGSESKRFCHLQRDNGMALTYFPNYAVGDKDAVYFDAAQCGVPYPFPFQITDVELLLFNHAEVDSVRLRFHVWSVGSDLDQGPQERLWTSVIYAVHTFYPDWASVSLPQAVCVEAPFFFGVEYVAGDVGSIPGLVSDDQQNMVDTSFQWVWLAADSPPWREWNWYWNDPDPGWLMVRLAGETYSLVCDTGWIWMSDNGYAPSGAPDVDESQNSWVGYCGPVAAGNCLEWFGISLNLGWSIPQFIDSLALYFGTDTAGTEVHSMKSGIDNFLNAFSLTGTYSSIWPAPDFYVMADSLEASQTIALLLGFWWYDGENWWREGGHFVTLAGVDVEELKTALSDPGRDEAEHGWPGRVRPPDHPSPPHPDTLHNDPAYVSHEIYRCSVESGVPANPDWQLSDYLEIDPDLAREYTGMNFPTEFLSYSQPAPAGTTFVTQVEYAIMLCTRQEHMFWEPACANYAPSGMPDFDQRQDTWISFETSQPTFCGPAAAANSFWWIDSKFDLPSGAPGDGSDQFPLVRDYLDNLSFYINWDDHDMWNVDHSGTPWTGVDPPPATPQPFVPGPQNPGGVSSWGEFVERLAWEMDTDGRRTLGAHRGTRPQDVDSALEQWFAGETFSDGSNLNDSLCVRIYQKPTFFLVDSLVSQHGNVVLLLGFWFLESNKWWRAGGHYVTVAGINPVESFLALSDPYFDNAENGGPGRILSGSYITHDPLPHGDSTIHNDPGNVSHDIYFPDLNFSNLAGVWQVPDYAISSDLDTLMNLFHRQNVPEEFVPLTQPHPPGNPVTTVVEYAILIDALDYRGDVNKDGNAELGDAIFLINYLFRQEAAPDPVYAGDLNCDGVVELGDIIFLLNYLFRNGTVPRCCGP